MYRNVGKAVMVSILDIFEKNPYTRITNTNFKNISNLRKEVAWETARTERFKRERGSHTKARKFN
jgi:hypothetical protein